jgi:hypothetical protein
MNNQNPLIQPRLGAGNSTSRRIRIRGARRETSRKLRTRPSRIAHALKVRRASDLARFPDPIGGFFLHPSRAGKVWRRPGVVAAAT